MDVNHIMRQSKHCRKIVYPLTEREAIIEKIIAKEYECPVCFNYAAPPIMMCLNSHIICFDCWKRCTNCPTCRVQKSLTRAHTLEKIHPLIGFPCKWEGCHYIGSMSYTSIHEQYCKKFPIKCPLGIRHQCLWKGTMETVQEHLKNEHEDNVYFASNVVLMCRGFAHATKKNYTIIFAVHKRLFKFYWNFNTQLSRKVKFGMVSIGNGNPVVIYNYTLTFAKCFPITHKCRKLKMIKAQVKKATDEHEPDSEENQLQERSIFNHEHDFQDLLSFCNGGDLYYQVIIEVSHLARDIHSRL